MAEDTEVGLRLIAHLRQEPILRVAANPYRIGDVDRRMVAAFVRMGGESSPWGVGWKIGRGNPEFRFAPEPRNRTAVQSMLLDFARALDGHFEDGKLELPQLFLPGPTHAEMLHFLAIRHARGTIGDKAALATLQRMGRRCYQLFDATINKNRTHCLDMTAVLKRLYAFPCEPAREAHLGYLMAWLLPGDRAMEAREAERLPVSTSIDPDVERGMERAVSDFNAGSTAAADSIGAMLRTEIMRRIDLTTLAIEAASESLDENAGVPGIVAASRREVREFSDRERTRAPGDTSGGPGLTGHVVADAAGFAGFEADQNAANRTLVPHDHLLQGTTIESGSGIEGSVVEVSRVAQRWGDRYWLEVECQSETLIRFRVGDSLVATTQPATDTEWKVEAIVHMENHRRIRLASTKSLDLDRVPADGADAVRFCGLEDAGLKIRLCEKVREAESDDPSRPTPGQWILDELQTRRRETEPSGAEELDLSGTIAAEDPDAAS